MVGIRALVASAIAIAVASQLALSFGAQARPAQIGTVSEVKSAAFGTPAGGMQAPKRLDDGVELDEFIETVPDGALQLALIDQTTVSMGGGSKLLLDELVFDPKTGNGSSVVKFAAGTFYWVTGKIATKDRIAIDTPTATIGIRGTEFSLKIGPDGATRIAVVEGLVELVSKTTGETLSIPAGHNGDVNAAGRTSALRVGIPATGDRAVDAVVSKAEEKAIRANLAKAANENASANAQKGQELKASQSQGAGRVLPIKAELMKVAVARGHGNADGTGLKLDRTRPITITAPTKPAGSRVAPRGKGEADTASKPDRDTRATPQGGNVEQAANSKVVVGGGNGGVSGVGGSGGIGNSGGGAPAGVGGGIGNAGGGAPAGVGGGVGNAGGGAPAGVRGGIGNAGAGMAANVGGGGGAVAGLAAGGLGKLGAGPVGSIGSGAIGNIGGSVVASVGGAPSGAATVPRNAPIGGSGCSGAARGKAAC